MRFFFYGTLLDGSDNPVARWVHDRLHQLGEATCAGRLQAIPNPEGWFPALLDGHGTVHGSVYEAREGFGAADLARLDAYEDFDPARPGVSLYIREARDVIVNGESVRAQVYRYNQPLCDGAQPIPGGNFRVWLAARGLAAFGGRRSEGSGPGEA